MSDGGRLATLGRALLAVPVLACGARALAYGTVTLAYGAVALAYGTVTLACGAVALAAGAGPEPLGREDFPDPGTKLGLQVQLVDDALALGIGHAGVNVQLGHLLAAEGTPAERRIVREVDGERFDFDRAALDGLAAQVRPLSEAGVVVHAILLLRRTGDARDERFLHPDHDPAAPNALSAFDARTERGRRFLRAVIGLLAERHGAVENGAAGSGAATYGAIHGWIVGNEVNSHGWWHNQGDAELERVVDDYERAVRLVHEMLTENSALPCRVYLSLEHHWTARFGPPTRSAGARPLLERFAALARERGDFPWHVAFHPYPEDLFDPAWWDDVSATHDPDAARVTFRNLEVLLDHLAEHAPRADGGRRSVILSEQGFHRPDGDAGELLQAAAFAAAWVRVRELDGIDAFILHRHVDHAGEGGLRLGLWTRAPDSLCTPDRPTRMHRVFAACGGPAAEAELAFALELLGLTDWDALPTRLGL